MTSTRLLHPLGALFVAVSIAACDGRDGVRIALLSKPPQTPDPRVLAIQGQVTGPVDGLRYRWYSVAGECEPQLSSTPETAFRFATGSSKDRVTVEVWRDGERLAQGSIDVELDRARLVQAAEPRPNVQVEITRIPPYEPDGGDATRADIAGRVTGDDVDPGYKVVVYARADAWYIQPLSQTLHALAANNTWSTWTHTGSSYAALVVRPGYELFTRLDALPQVGGYVVARTIVDGVRK